MHSWLLFSSLFLLLLTDTLILRLQQGIVNFTYRRGLQLLALFLPIGGLGSSIGGIVHFLRYTCVLQTSRWDLVIAGMVLLGIGSVFIGALLLGMLRLILFRHWIAAQGSRTNLNVQQIADQLAVHLGVTCLPIHLWQVAAPLAFTYGLFQPIVVLSSWMLEHLTQYELEAVLTHELEHVARHDYAIIWLATVLRDAFFYVPGSQHAYRQLQQEKELACDALVVQATHRPAALASALAKVWQARCASLPKTPFGIALHLDGGETSLTERLERLLDPTVAGSRTRSSWRSHLLPIGIGLLGVSLIAFANVLMVLTWMGCSPFPFL